MIKEPSNTKIFTLTVEVDIDKLTDAYTGGEPELAVSSTTREATDLISMLEYELEGWLNVVVKSIEEVEE